MLGEGGQLVMSFANAWVYIQNHGIQRAQQLLCSVCPEG